MTDNEIIKLVADQGRQIGTLEYKVQQLEAQRDEYKNALAFIYGWFPTNVSQPVKQVSEMKEFAFNIMNGNTTVQAEMGRRKISFMDIVSTYGEQP